MTERDLTHKGSMSPSLQILDSHRRTRHGDKKVTQQEVHGLINRIVSDADVWFQDLHENLLLLQEEILFHIPRPRSQLIPVHVARLCRRKNDPTVVLQWLRRCKLILDTKPVINPWLWCRELLVAAVSCPIALQMNKWNTDALLLFARIFGVDGKFEFAVCCIKRYECIMGEDESDEDLKRAKEEINERHVERKNSQINWNMLQRSMAVKARPQDTQGSSENWRDDPLVKQHAMMEQRSAKGQRKVEKKQRSTDDSECKTSDPVDFDIPESGIICNNMPPPHEEQNSRKKGSLFAVAAETAIDDGKAEAEEQNKCITITKDHKIVVTEDGLEKNVSFSEENALQYLEMAEKKVKESGQAYPDSQRHDVPKGYQSDHYLEEGSFGKQLTYATYSKAKHDVEELLSLVTREPDKFIKGRYEQSQKTSGKVVPFNKECNFDIRIPTRRKCADALDNDIVVVELLDEEPPECDVDRITYRPKEVRYGTVVGVLERAVNPYTMRIICLLDEHCDNIMLSQCGDSRFPNMKIRDDKKLKTKSNGSVIIPIYRVKEASAENAFSFEFNRMAEISRDHRRNQLFITRFLSWNAESSVYPECIVTGLLPPGTDVKSATTVLKAKYGLSDIDEEQLDGMEQTFSSVTGAVQKRADYTDLLVFTIDPENAKALDDGFSVEIKDGGTSRIGIHIADVAARVQIDSKIDSLARKRASSFNLPDHTTAHMLPKKTRELCSLQPGEDRFAISVFIIIDENGDIKGKEICKTIIKSRDRMTLQEVQDIICDEPSPKLQDRKDAIKLLQSFVQTQRKQRLENAHNAEAPIDYCERRTSTQDARKMVEEMMIVYNRYIAKAVLEIYPESTPLRRQQRPDEQKLTDFKKSHGILVNCSSQISSKVSPIGRVRHSTVKILKTLLRRVFKANDEGNMKLVKKLISNDESHPNLLLMSLHHNCICRDAEFICSDPNKDPSHYDLRVDSYSQGTSPIRRYPDLVMQRMIHTFLSKKGPPYSKDELTVMSSSWNVAKYRERCYKRDSDYLRLALDLQKSPLKTYAVVEDVNETSVVLRVIHMSGIPHDGKSISYSLMKVCKKPKVDVLKRSVSLEWSEHIYDANINIGGDCCHDSRDQKSKYEHVVDIYTRHWQNLNTAIGADNSAEIKHALNVIKSKLKDSIEDVAISLAGEDRKGSFPQNFKLILEPSDVLQVQLGTRMVRGLISPCITAIFPVPGYCICLEHRRDPVGCFSSTCGEKLPDLKSRKTIAEFKKIMLQVLSMSSAADAIRQYSNTFIHNVPIKWTKIPSGGFKGVFTLSKKYCKERSIRFYQKHDLVEDDYICIQFHNVRCEKDQKKDPASQSVIEEYFSWFGHFVIERIEEAQHFSDSVFRIHVTLKRNDFQLLRLLSAAGENIDQLRWTVELIRKPIPERRFEEAVRKLDTATDFIKNILLGNAIQSDQDEVPNQDRMFSEADDILKEIEDKWNGEHESRLWRRKSEKLPWWNPDQKRVVMMALKKKFTFIQGPPGTGKSNAAAYIAYAFILKNRGRKRNKMSGKKTLVCAPSNKAADVFAGYLKKFDVRVIRMYSKSKEAKDYPVPGQSSCSSERHGYDTSDCDKDLKDITLHHVIRNKPNDNLSRKLRSYKDKFEKEMKEFKKKNKTYVVPERIYQEYRELEERLEKDELGKSEVVVCTCSEAASTRIGAMEQHIEQCIIDEAGMSTEPETLIPLVSASPKKVVLIGDHLQLQAIVTHEPSKRRGLDVSLLERYCRECEPEQLTIQYRMHEKLCQFPNRQFYKGKLQTADKVKKREPEPKIDSVWPKLPSGERNPTIFCNVIGKEETLQVTTEEGNEQSKKNLKEIKEVVRILKALVHNRGVRQNRIQVLSQYRSQLSDLEAELTRAKLEDIVVNSVIGFQGSENDYVILSLVRSMPLVEIEEKPTTGWKTRHLGFITDEHQINVALTRARRGLIIIGNERLLRTDNVWKNLIEEYEKNGCLYQEGQFVP